MALAARCRRYFQDAWEFADKEEHQQQLDIVWLDFGQGEKVGQFIDKVWSRIRPGGLVLCHSTLTNSLTRDWLEKMRARVSPVQPWHTTHTHTGGMAVSVWLLLLPSLGCSVRALSDCSSFAVSFGSGELGHLCDHAPVLGTGQPSSAVPAVLRCRQTT